MFLSQLLKEVHPAYITFIKSKYLFLNKSEESYEKLWVDFFVNSRYIRSLNDGEEFGARSLILSTEKRSASAIANGEVTCYTLTADVFKSILEPNLYEYFTNKHIYDVKQNQYLAGHMEERKHSIDILAISNLLSQF